MATRHPLDVRIEQRIRERRDHYAQSVPGSTPYWQAMRRARVDELDWVLAELERERIPADRWMQYRNSA